MIKYIDKTTYLDYLQCPKNIWLKIHKPELKELFALSAADVNQMQQGNLVENYARKLFPDGIFLNQVSHEAALLAQELHNKSSIVMFQTTFIHDKFLARVDILKYDCIDKKWELYEVKGNNSTEENSKKIDHIEDATFQTIILEKQGLTLKKISIIHLNDEYILGDQLDPNKLFVIDNITEKVRERESNTIAKMAAAKKDLLETTDLKQSAEILCQCIYKGRSSHCATFAYSHPHVPTYSIHDLTRIGLSKKNLKALVDNGIFKIEDIPAHFKLSDRQNNQVKAYNEKSPIINFAAIQQELDSLQYPLYFFDYETYNPAIPMFKGFYPYQHIPFQFSLHVVANKNSEPQHFEYLHNVPSDPSPNIIKKLQEFISNQGSIIVWNKSFEIGKNSELAERHPEFKEFLENINARIYDLMDIFDQQIYVDANFKGSSSIKKVLPTLVPQLSYKKLAIQKGDDASQKWFSMIYGNLTISEKHTIAQDLKKYCCLDTYAMYAIWKYLVELCTSSVSTDSKNIDTTVFK